VVSLLRPSISGFEENAIARLTPDSIVVFNDAEIHHGQRFKDLVVNHGMRVEYLPPYSPDCNTKELTFNSNWNREARSASINTESQTKEAISFPS